MSTTAGNWRRRFARSCRVQVRLDEPMRVHTTLRVGGPAALMAWLEDTQQLLRACSWLDEQGRPWRLLGGGSNLLVADAGWPGAVLRLAGELAAVRTLHSGSRWVDIEAGGGARLARLLNYAARRGGGGLAGLWAIPGTVGGAVKYNAGTRLGTIADYLLEAQLLEGGRLRWWSAAGLGFAYRRSRIGRRRVVVRARFRLPRHSPERLARDRERARALRRRQPRGQASAGCFFRNPPGRQSAGWLIEQSGGRGLRLGAARISDQHANFLVNCGGASAYQLWLLARRVARLVRQRTGVRLRPEVECWGEFRPPAGRQA